VDRSKCGGQRSYYRLLPELLHQVLEALAQCLIQVLGHQQLLVVLILQLGELVQ
jgi:hypothetical protein